jgi:hypothetical protein
VPDEEEEDMRVHKNLIGSQYVTLHTPALGMYIDDKVLGHNVTTSSIDAELENQSGTELLNCSRTESTVLIFKLPQG